MVYDIYAYNYKLLVNRQLRFAKKQYFDRKFNECSNNIRKKWKLLNFLMCRGKSCNYNVLNINGVDCNDSALNSNHFNSYFSSIANEINNDIPLSNASTSDYMGPSLPASFLCLPATEDEECRVISSFVYKGLQFR